MSISKLLFISVISLIICILSAVIVENIPTSDERRPDWDNFGKAIWITILITIPAFCVFFTALIAALIKIFSKKYRSK